MMNTAVFNLSDNPNTERVCLKVMGPGFVVGTTIDVEPGFPIRTVGDLLRSLRRQTQLAFICRQHNCDLANGDLYYRNRRLEQVNERLLQDVGVDQVVLTRGGRDTLEYRIYSVSDTRDLCKFQIA